jgi:hypothetical protein
MKAVWTEALEILNSEGAHHQNSKQLLPRDLDNDELYGREHIQTLMGMKSHGGGATTFVDIAQPFLSVITHREILSCLSVDTAVGGLYNFISGSNGFRAIRFFQGLTANLPNAIIEEARRQEILGAMCTTLQELLKREQRARFHDDLPGLIDSIEAIAGAIDGDDGGAALEVAKRKITELRGIVARAKGLLHEEDEEPVDGVSTTVTASTYPREIMLPGYRHDNDKTDITDIKIMPTEGEIRSNHAEFLPSTDLYQPHFLQDQAERHLDTHFRLLRHDIFGELKESLAGLIAQIENDPSLLTQSKLSLGNTRAYLYHQAQVRYLSMNKRHHLETQISFPQLPMLRKKSKTELSRWWSESKRLEDGVLLCFVFYDGARCSLVFFTVNSKDTDHRKDYTLANSDLATTTGKLASFSQVNFDLLVHLSHAKTRGVLIELPGVILATFKPILENLQNMQRLNRLPFRQWILPERVNPSTLPLIPPPLYARKAGFRFSLNPILKKPGDDLSIRSDTAVNDDYVLNNIAARTNLDQSQSRALLAALLCEFSHIQGPPGTGKSYVGVNIMRVLLNTAKKAKLGPIIVV